jgi:hypothetical protein
MWQSQHNTDDVVTVNVSGFADDNGIVNIIALM